MGGGRSEMNGPPMETPLTTRSKATSHSLVKEPSRKEFLKAIELTSNASELIDVFRSRFDIRKKVKMDQETLLMRGRTEFDLPDAHIYKKTLQLANESD